MAASIGLVIDDATAMIEQIARRAVFVGLSIANVELDITAMMGAVMVVVIATEKVIFLVSEYQLLAKTMPLRLAILEAALNRLRPITMSTLAMIPAHLLLGAAISGARNQMLQPLAIAIMAGTAVRLPMVLLARPVLVGLALPHGSNGGTAQLAEDCQSKVPTPAHEEGQATVTTMPETAEAAVREHRSEWACLTNS